MKDTVTFTLYLYSWRGSRITARVAMGLHSRSFITALLFGAEIFDTCGWSPSQPRQRGTLLFSSFFHPTRFQFLSANNTHIDRGLRTRVLLLYTSSRYQRRRVQILYNNLAYFIFLCVLYESTRKWRGDGEPVVECADWSILDAF